MAETDDLQFHVIHYTTPELHGELISVKKVAESVIPKPSRGRQKGRQVHPFDMVNATRLMFSVSTQQTCIQTKRDATVGLGFETEQDRQKRSQMKQLDQTLQNAAVSGDPKASPADPKPKPVAKVDPPAPPQPPSGGEEDGSEPKVKSKVEEVLDPLTDCGFQSLMNQVGEDYENTGNGYFEVIRDTPTGPPTGLWHLPAPAMFVYWEATDAGDYHYEMDDISGKTVKFARFGDVEGLRSRLPNLDANTRIAEVVHFKMPTSFDPSYGIPQWTAAVTWLEMAQQALQMEYDFYQNRAVPDLIAFLMGRKLPPKEFEDFKNQLKATIGAGKRFRSLVVNFSDPELKVQIERLQETGREKLAELWPTLELAIVSGHRVPATLAGIQTPGKMGAANELPNALVAFQTLYIGQHQRIFQDALGLSLGSQEAGLGLAPTDFLLRRITDSYDMGQIDTMSRMRQTATEAQMQGRKLDQGLKE